MKILRLYTRLPPYPGGMEKHIAHLTEEQVNLGHDVTIYFNKGSKVTSKDIQVTKLPIYKLKPQFLGLFFFHALVFSRLFLKQEKFDIIHIHGDWSSLIFARCIKKIVGASKIIMSIHDELSENFFSIKALKFLLRPVDILFASGYALESQLRKITKNEVIVQPSGINKIFFEPQTRVFNTKPIQIIVTANLVKKKNLGLVLDIAKHLSTIKFLVVGEGPQKPYILRRILDEKIENVNMLGYKKPIDLRSLYYQSDIFLSTSEKEGTPTAMIEAMACGLPIVTSQAGGVEAIVGKHNYVIDKNETQYYVDCILELFQKVNQVEEISKLNISISKSFSWADIAKKIDNYILEEV
jgi:L-malate glycosyltransferase|tara:strand:+ start:1549 stop:2607 length:1059 start_codon:yes stop_codon:yes gene_type:complete